MERGEEAARLDWRIVEAERVLERLRRERRERDNFFFLSGALTRPI